MGKDCTTCKYASYITFNDEQELDGCECLDWKNSINMYKHIDLGGVLCCHYKKENKNV